MKKIIILLAAIAVAAAAVVVIVLFTGTSDAPEYVAEPPLANIADALRFKAEHEDLNGVVPNPDFPERVFRDMYIPLDVPFRYVEYDEIIQLFETNGSGVVYLSFPICPWCRTFIPVLIDAAREFGVYEILYRDVLDDRNILELRDGVIHEVRAGHPGYYRLLELLGDFAPEYTGLNDPTIRRTFVPALIFIRNGEIIRYQGVLASFLERATDNGLGGWQEMNDDEVYELTQIFMDYFRKVFGDIDDCVSSAC